MLKHGVAVRPSMCLASLDIKMAFDEAKSTWHRLLTATIHTDG